MFPLGKSKTKRLMKRWNHLWGHIPFVRTAHKENWIVDQGYPAISLWSAQQWLVYEKNLRREKYLVFKMNSESRWPVLTFGQCPGCPFKCPFYRSVYWESWLSVIPEQQRGETAIQWWSVHVTNFTGKEQWWSCLFIIYGLTTFHWCLFYFFGFSLILKCFFKFDISKLKE